MPDDHGSGLDTGLDGLDDFLEQFRSAPERDLAPNRSLRRRRRRPDDQYRDAEAEQCAIEVQGCLEALLGGNPLQALRLLKFLDDRA